MRARIPRAIEELHPSALSSDRRTARSRIFGCSLSIFRVYFTLILSYRLWARSLFTVSSRNSSWARLIQCR